jgi:hypothetical protein
MDSSQVFILDTTNDSNWQKLVELSPDKFQIVNEAKTFSDTAAVVLDETALPSHIYEKLLDGKQKIINIRLKNFNKKEDFQKLTEFLGSVNFRYKPEEGYNFVVKKPPVWKY